MHSTSFFRLGYVSAFLLTLMAAPIAHAATSPTLGTAAAYSILAGTSVTNSGTTNISGSVGISPGAGLPPNTTGWGSVTLGGTLNDSNPAALAAQADRDIALGALNSQGCDVTYAGAFKELAGVTLTPGVYCATSFHLSSGTLTLDGPASGVWIFKSTSDLVVTGPSSVAFSGAGQPCNVWWSVVSAASLDVSSSFVGSILAGTSVTLGTGATLNGRALASTALVSLLGNTITGPTCVAAPAPAPAPSLANVAPLLNLRKVPSPLALPAGPGQVKYTYTITNPGTITITNVTLVDDKCSNVTFVSGDTDGDGRLQTYETWIYTCTDNLSQTTINYATATGQGNDMSSVDTAIAEVVVGVPVIPPLIHILKTPSPLALPFNGGSVTYGYVVSNPGTVALTGVTVTDDKCSNVTFVSGDTNSDARLQTTETWRYTCTMNVPLTMTNTAIATGHANGLTAIDTAIATVVTAGSPVPPLIHIIKKADPVILPVAGGVVTYGYSVTNPGTVPLSNVSVTDDKCTAITAIAGDANGNGLLDTNETWTYSCSQNLTVTTTNTATATGSANGLTVTDISLASVTLSPALIPPAPSLPNTGYAPVDALANWIIAAAGLFVGLTLLFALNQRKNIS